MAKAASAPGTALLTYVSLAFVSLVTTLRIIGGVACLLLQILSVKLLPRQVFLTVMGDLVKEVRMRGPARRFALDHHGRADWNRGCSGWQSVRR